MVITFDRSPGEWLCVHRVSARWLALGCGLLLACSGLSSALAQSFKAAPRVTWTEAAETTATITWDTSSPGRGVLHYGISTNYTGLLRDAGGAHRHALTLRGLTPGTRYFYEASPSGVGTPWTGSFQTAPLPGAPVHFAIHGDLHGGVDTNAARGVAERIADEAPAWVINLGDLSDEGYGAPDFATWGDFFATCSNLLARSIFMPILGNHDNPSTATDGLGQSRSLFHRLFSLPEPSLGEGYYAFTAGPVRFITLNTERDHSAQTNWLARELQAAAHDTNLTWIVSYYHRPPYSWGEREGWDEARTNFAPLHAQYETDWVISGHSHNYQRTIPIRGVRYLVAGGGGGRLYTSADGISAHAFATTCYHHASVHITGGVMQVRGIRSDGLVFDSVTVTNRRQVRVDPAFPKRGQPVTIRYQSSEGPLREASPVYLHIGQDAFAGAFADTPMTWNPDLSLWEHTLTVPVTASNRLAFVFHDAAGTNWHNNYDLNWQALLDRVDLQPPAPIAGSNLVICYQADMGHLVGATAVGAWISWNRDTFRPTGLVAMANSSGAVWTCTLAVPAGATDFTLGFSDGTRWDDDYKRWWRGPVTGATTPVWPPAPYVAEASPEVTDDPPGGARNNVGDNMDLSRVSPPVEANDVISGFGDGGSLWINHDETNLYLGAYGMNLGGSNNVLVLFLGLDTLTDDAWNLWHLGGLPQALDQLHNLRFTEPMDVALVLGDQYGDKPAYTNFTYGGYNFGQGVFYLNTNSSSMTVMTNARLSQFDGYGDTPCATAEDAPHRQTMRWEARLPWRDLGAAAGPHLASNLFLAGVFASPSVSGSDRYLSHACFGERAWGATDAYRQFAYQTVTLRPVRLHLLHGERYGDGIPNRWRIEQFGTPEGAPGNEDTDGDGHDTWSEYVAGTDPLDGQSVLAGSVQRDGSGGVLLTWPTVLDRRYTLARSTNLLAGFEAIASALTGGSFTDSLSTADEACYRVEARIDEP